jgi:LacI family transcriptional regulator, galactose operon repressor
MKKKRLTLRDIAGLAGVSHTTVSRVLNHDHRVKPETVARVRAVVDANNFRLNPLARQLARGQSNLIGLMVSDIKNPFYADMARSIEDQARKRGYLVIICSTDEQAEVVQWYTKTVIEAGIDGLIFASVKWVEPAVENLIGEGFPTLLVNRRLKAEIGDYVVLDNWKGAQMATRHLIDNGYQKIAMVTGPENVSTAVERLRGYEHAMKENRLPLNRGHMHHVRFSRREGFAAAMGLLEGKQRPEAIFGGNDVIAMGIMDAARQKRLRVPQDLAIVGFDDTEFAQAMGLTTVSQRVHTMGRMAVERLIQKIKHEISEKDHRVVLEPELIIRESSRPMT